MARFRQQSRGNLRQLCLFYCRFGKCNRGDKCPYKHDSDKVAVCTRFLRGTCKVSNCLFSHKVSEDKMPVCNFFLRGVCSRDICPYRHINVGPNAQPCLEFARGHCSSGDKCTKSHVLICPEHQRGEKCPRGKMCPLRHHKSQKPNLKSKQSRCHMDTKPCTVSTEASCAKKMRKSEDEDDINLPMKQRNLPSFIALDQSDTSLNNLEPSLPVPAKSYSKPTTGIFPNFLRKS